MTDKYKINKNVPFKKEPRIDELKELISKMEVGDSMYLKTKSDRDKFFHRQQAIKFKQWDKVQKEDENITYEQFENNISIKYTIRKEGNGFRAWRLR